MRARAMTTVSLLVAFTIGLTLQSPVAHAQTVPQVTIPNGSSPAKANAPRAPMNDSDAARRDWNHGNGTLWVNLAPNAVLTIAAPAPADDELVAAIKGYSRVKFGWWRGGPGTFTIEGRRLDAPATPLRYRIQPEAYGAFGFIPSSLYFPTDGYWEITGRIDDKRLTFIVHVVSTPATASPLAQR